MTRRLLTIGHSYVVDVNRRLAHELQEQSNGRWKVTVVAPEQFIGKNDIRPQRFEPRADEPTKVVSLPARLTSRVHLFWYGGGLRRLIREGNFDLVHAWEEPYIHAGWQIARAARGVSPVVFTTCQNKSKQYPLPFSWMEHYCVQQQVGWTFIGHLVESALLSRAGYSERPRHHMPLGIDASLFAPNAARGAAVRRGLGWEGTTPVVGYMGRLVEEKGIRVMMRALASLAAPWRLLVVGAGPLQNELRRWGEQWPGRVVVADAVKHNDVARYINAMDLLVAPSLTAPHWREQLGRMIVEAFACSVPVIGSDSGEIPFVIGDAGLVTPEGDDEALATALSYLLTDEAQRHELGERGRRRAMDQFTWAAIARDTLSFFDRLLGDSPRLPETTSHA